MRPRQQLWPTSWVDRANRYVRALIICGPAFGSALIIAGVIAKFEEDGLWLAALMPGAVVLMITGLIAAFAYAYDRGQQVCSCQCITPPKIDFS